MVIELLSYYTSSNKYDNILVKDFGVNEEAKGFRAPFNTGREKELIRLREQRSIGKTDITMI